MAVLVSVLGDSVSTYEDLNPAGYDVFYTPERARDFGLLSADDTWWAQVIRALGGSVLVNASYSGSMVEGAGFPAASSMERARDLCCADTRPDLVLIAMGINDYGWGGSDAQAAGRAAAMPPSTDLSLIPQATEAVPAPEDTVSRFESAYALMLQHIHETCPDARIVCITPPPGRKTPAGYPTFTWSLRGHSLREYADAVCRAAADNHAVVADICALQLDYEALDGTHPTPRGMQQLASAVLAALGIEGYGPDDTWPGYGTPRERELWASKELCSDRTCVGCPHATVGATVWNCVCTAAFLPETTTC